MKNIIGSKKLDHLTTKTEIWYSLKTVKISVNFYAQAYVVKPMNE